MTTQIQLQSFNFKSSAVRVITDPNQEFWFCGKDVCDILGYTNDSKALKDHCKAKGVTKRYSLTEGGNQELVYINEPNLYRLIIKSRKPEAEPFEAWVFEEVLPQIRKTGQYSLQNPQNLLPAEQATITPEQQQQIQNAVQSTHHRTGMSYAEIYTRIKNKFKVAKYDQLLQSQHRDAMLYIASMQPCGLTQDYVFKLKEADFLVLALYLNIIKKSAADLVELGRFAHNQNNEGFSQLAIDSRFELVGKTFKHLHEQILTQAKNCQPHYQQLIMNALA